MYRRLFLFDLDWTVIYTGGAGVRALDYAFEQRYKIPQAMKTISPDGKTDPAIIREMIQVHLQRGPLEGEIEALCQAYVDRLHVEVPAAEGYQIMPGIPEILESLSKLSDVLVGLGTGNLEAGAMAKLSRTTLTPYFKFGGYATDSENRPDVLRAAVRRGEKLAGHPFKPRQVIVIGDHYRDIDAGKAIGAITVAVATGRLTSGDLSAHKPDFIFQDLSETLKVLEALLTDAD